MSVICFLGRFIVMVSIVCMSVGYSLHAQPFWEHAFDGPYTRLVGTLELTAQGTVLASAEGKLFRSEDGGMNWSISNDGLYPDVRDILGHPSGTVVAIASPNATLGHLFYSEDDGRTWKFATIESTEQTNFTTVAIDHDGLLYAGNSRHHVDNITGIFRSTDGGRSWQPHGVFDHASIYSILCDTGGVFVARNSDFYNNRESIVRSTDSGRTWSKVEIENFTSYGSLVDLVRDSSGAYLAHMSRGSFRSTDRGVTWTRSDSAWSRMTQLIVLSNGSYLGSIRRGFLRSSDFGSTWDTVSISITDMSVGHIAYDPGSGLMVVGSDVGIYRSDDHGASWERPLRGIPARLGRLAVHKNTAMIQGWRAVYHSENLTDWTRAPYDGGVMLDRNGDYIISGDSLRRSTDAGVTWNTIGRKGGAW